MPWWVEFPLVLLASLGVSYLLGWVFTRHRAMEFFDKHLKAPLVAALVICGLNAILKDPHLRTIEGMAAYLSSDPAY